MQRIILCTGGTGGHIFPALAVAEHLRERFPGTEVLFVGGKSGPEREWAARAGLPFRGLPARGVLGRGLKSLGALWWLGRGLTLSWLLMGSFRPQVVLGLGGYAGFAPVLAARWRRIPTAIHEQNSLPGVTNRVLGKRVDRVFLSFPDEQQVFSPEKSVVTGNPVRREILALRGKENRAAQGPGGRVLVLGGSQGAAAINAAVLDALPAFKAQDITLWHQTGPQDAARAQEAYAAVGMQECRVENFIEDMAAAYAWADLVVCRAGATTVAELTAVGMPSVLIPFPYATHNHQLLNARRLESVGAALVLVQSYLQEVSLARAVGDLLNMPGKLKDMGRAAGQLGHPRAAEDIVAGLEELVRRKQTGNGQSQGRTEP